MCYRNVLRSDKGYYHKQTPFPSPSNHQSEQEAMLLGENQHTIGKEHKAYPSSLRS